MMPATLMSPALSKEIRGLLPTWAACMAALAGALVSRSDGLLLDAAIVAYIVGPIALGAQSIGQEYAYRTLPMLLSQPVDRRRVLLLKFAVLAVMVLTLAALASNVLMGTARHTAMWQHVSVQVLPVLGGLFVAPWVTMVCRSSLAGILGTSSFASLTFIVQIVIVGAWFGIGAEAAQARIIGPWSIAMIACCALGAVLSVRGFIGLEAIEGPLPSLHLPRWWARAGRTRVRRPLRALVVKELHLQQLTFVIAGFFIAGTAAVSVLQRVVPLWSDFPIGMVTALYCALLSIWIGAIASAEERQHGTLEWQLLQPAPAWQQWTVKVGVTFAVALLCGVGLPLLLVRILPAGGLQVISVSRDFGLVILLLTAGSIYISSLSSSGVRAMVLTLPIGVAIELWLRAVGGAMRWGTSRLAGQYMADIVTGVVATRAVDPADIIMFTTRAFALTLAPLLLWFGFVNHRSTERSVRRIVVQGVSIALIIMAAVLAGGGLSAFYELRSR
jgi:ABC-2 family transporter